MTPVPDKPISPEAEIFQKQKPYKSCCCTIISFKNKKYLCMSTEFKRKKLNS